MELNAVIYVASYVAKIVLVSHDRLTCRAKLMCTTGMPSSIRDKFTELQLYAHCKPGSLHTPSEFLVTTLSECREIFVHLIDNAKFECSVHQKLYDAWFVRACKIS